MVASPKVELKAIFFDGGIRLAPGFEYKPHWNESEGPSQHPEITLNYRSPEFELEFGGETVILSDDTTNPGRQAQTLIRHSEAVVDEGCVERSAELLTLEITDREGDELRLVTEIYRTFSFARVQTGETTCSSWLREWSDALFAVSPVSLIEDWLERVFVASTILRREEAARLIILQLKFTEIGTRAASAL